MNFPQNKMAVKCRTGSCMEPFGGNANSYTFPLEYSCAGFDRSVHIFGQRCQDHKQRSGYLTSGGICIVLHELFFPLCVAVVLHVQYRGGRIGRRCSGNCLRRVKSLGLIAIARLDYLR